MRDYYTRERATRIAAYQSQHAQARMLWWDGATYVATAVALACIAIWCLA